MVEILRTDHGKIRAALAADRLAFLDFEASSLDDDGWPIEIGLAWFETSVLPPPGRIAPDRALSVETAASLIRPRPDWPRRAWSAASARVHGITLEALEDAPDAGEVTSRFGDLMRGRIVLSDAPTYDGFWWRRLIALAPEAPPIRLAPFYAAANVMFSGNRAAVAAVHAALDGPPPHRAAADAARLAQAWASGLAEVSHGQVAKDDARA